MPKIHMPLNGKGLAVLSLALLVGVLWFLGNPEQVYACKCSEPGSPSEEFEMFSAVFAGKVVSIQHSYDPSAASVSPEDRTTVGFEVSTVWKGTVHEDMYITTPPTGGSCGFSFSEGEEYIVYADDVWHDDSYTAVICSRTALLGQAQADIDAFGSGRAPQAGTGGPLTEQTQDTAISMAWAIILAVAAAVLGIVIGGIGVFALVKRRR